MLSDKTDTTQIKDMNHYINKDKDKSVLGKGLGILSNGAKYAVRGVANIGGEVL